MKVFIIQYGVIADNEGYFGFESALYLFNKIL